MTAVLLHGDCLEVMKDLSANSIDCFICDLPYGCLHPTGLARKEPERFRNGTVSGGCAWDIKLDLDAFWREVKRLAKDENTPVLMFCSTRFGYELIKSNEKWFRYDIVWDKGRGISFLSANKMPLRSHEMIYVFSKAGARYERVDISGGTPWAAKEKSLEDCKMSVYYRGETEYKWVLNENKGTRCVKSVVPISTSPGRGKHPTEKPMALYTWLIERYCPKGGTILDPTAGSFNSVAAAIALGRKAIGIEKDDGYYKKAVERFQPETNEIVG